MVQGKAIPEVVQWIVVRLSTNLSADEISMYTNVGVRKVNEIIAYFKKTGEIKVSSRSKRQLQQTLCNYDIEVCGTPSLTNS
jgi:hypothetical protein